MIEDIYSRKIVGWEVHSTENGELAAELLQRSVWAEKCAKSTLTLHSDNGSPMMCLTMQAKMYELGVSGSRSRPGVSNDNPYSESLFRTVKYCPRWSSQDSKQLTMRDSGFMGSCSGTTTNTDIAALNLSHLTNVIPVRTKRYLNSAQNSIRKNKCPIQKDGPETQETGSQSVTCI